MEDRQPILVTAAAGQTGGHTVRQLLEKGHSVRALVHRRDDRAGELASLGAEIVVGDFHDLGSLREAMAGEWSWRSLTIKRLAALRSQSFFSVPSCLMIGSGIRGITAR